MGRTSRQVSGLVLLLFLFVYGGTTSVSTPKVGKDTAGVDSVISRSDSSQKDPIGQLIDSLKKQDSTKTTAVAVVKPASEKAPPPPIPSPKTIVQHRALLHFPTHLGWLMMKALLVLVCLVIIGAAIFYLFFRDDDRGRFLTNTRLSIMDKEVQRACRYIEEHYSNGDLTVEGICEAIVTGPSFLEALYEKELGMTVEDFIAQVRVNRARQIMGQAPSMSTEEVAHRVGFKDEESLARTFDLVTKLSLAQYRTSLT